jgi:NADH:ubiquinone oxidoreductase subunit 2 (subunit N)
VSLYYYLAVIRAMWGSPAELQFGAAAAAGGSPPRDVLLHLSVVGALGFTIASFFFVQPIIDVARDAASSLPF